MAPQEERLKRLIEAIFVVHQNEDICDCDTCAQQFDCLVELVNSGANLRDILPAVEEHLRCCPDCSEEFQALASILRAEPPRPLNTPPQG
jgi:predicted anti-sigma-YlaC factor YlaD